MPLTKGQRKKLHQKFASLIGGTDADGNEHKLAPSEREREIKRSKELFVVRDFEKDNAIWEFVDGRRVLDFIQAGRYDIEYLGKNKDVLGNKKVRTKMIEQIKQIVAGKRAKNEKAGTFETEDYYEDLLKGMLKKLEERFTEYDNKKQEQLE